MFSQLCGLWPKGPEHPNMHRKLTLWKNGTLPTYSGALTLKPFFMIISQISSGLLLTKYNSRWTTLPNFLKILIILLRIPPKEKISRLQFHISLLHNPKMMVPLGGNSFIHSRLPILILDFLLPHQSAQSFSPNPMFITYHRVTRFLSDPSPAEFFSSDFFAPQNSPISSFSCSNSSRMSAVIVSSSVWPPSWCFPKATGWNAWKATCWYGINYQAQVVSLDFSHQQTVSQTVKVGSHWHQLSSKTTNFSSSSYGSTVTFWPGLSLKNYPQKPGCDSFQKPNRFWKVWQVRPCIFQSSWCGNPRTRKTRKTTREAETLY